MIFKPSNLDCISFEFCFDVLPTYRDFGLGWNHMFRRLKPKTCQSIRPNVLKCKFGFQHEKDVFQRLTFPAAHKHASGHWTEWEMVPPDIAKENICRTSPKNICRAPPNNVFVKDSYSCTDALTLRLNKMFKLFDYLHPEFVFFFQSCVPWAPGRVSFPSLGRLQ